MANLNRALRRVGSGGSQVASGLGQVARGVQQISRGLFSTVAAGVDAVVRNLARQRNVLQDQVEGTIRSIIGQVTSGVWVGAGADAFVRELQTEFLPISASLDSGIAQIAQSVQSAQQIVEEADNQAAQVVNTWTELLDSIF